MSKITELFEGSPHLGYNIYCQGASSITKIKDVKEISFKQWACWMNWKTDKNSHNFGYGKFPVTNDAFDYSNYLYDLKENFNSFAGIEIEINSNNEAFLSVDFTTVSGVILLGIASYLRAVNETPYSVLSYLYLRENHPELNFYQRLVAAQYIINSDWEIHEGGHRPLMNNLNYIKNLSLETLKKEWEKTPEIFIPFKKYPIFSSCNSGRLDHYSQYHWLPKPWGMIPTAAYGNIGAKVPSRVNYSKETIEFLLNDDPNKDWLK